MKMEEFQVLAHVSNGKEIIAYIETGEILPDLCLIDMQLPEDSGLEYAKWIKKNYPNTKVIMLTEMQSHPQLERGIIVGIDGYILKESSLDQFKYVLLLAMDDQFVVPKYFINKFSERLSELHKIEREDSLAFIEGKLQQKELSEKELKLIQYINRGWTNKLIAEELDITRGTVKNYISMLYKKMDISNRDQLRKLLEQKTS